MTVGMNPELLQSLPAKAQDELRQRPEYVAITKAIERLSLDMTTAESEADIPKLELRRNQLLEQRRALVKQELGRARHAQERIHPSEREGPFYPDRHRSLFDRVRHMMEERSRLSSTLFRAAPLRSSEGNSVVKDLITLLKDPYRVAYQPLLRPE